MNVNLSFPQRFLVEPFTYYFLFVLASFAALTFQPQVAWVYVALIAADFVFWTSCKAEFDYNSIANNTIKALFIAVGAYVLFYFVTYGIVTFLQSSVVPNQVAFNNHLQSALLGATDTPILAGNKIMTFIVFAIFIPIVETRTLVGRNLEFLGAMLNEPIKLMSKATWFILILVGTIAAAFHLQVKGVDANVDLLIVLAFFTFSAGLVVWQREMESAVYLHIINNGMLMLSMFGIKIFSVFGLPG